jgi:hypothetical protein
VCEPLGRSEGHLVVESRGRLRNMGAERELWRPCWRGARRPGWAASGAGAVQEREWLPTPSPCSEYSLLSNAPILDDSRFGRGVEWGTESRSEQREQRPREAARADRPGRIKPIENSTEVCRMSKPTTPNSAWALRRSA